MSQNLQSRPYTAWQLIRSYWQSEQRFIAYAFLLFCDRDEQQPSLAWKLFLPIGVTIFTMHYKIMKAWCDGFNICLSYLFGIGLHCACKCIVIIFKDILGLRWRRWLTDQFIDPLVAKQKLLLS